MHQFLVTVNIWYLLQSMDKSKKSMIMKKNMYQILWAICLIFTNLLSAQSPDSCADLALIQLNVIEFTPTDQTISFHLKILERRLLICKVQH